MQEILNKIKSVKLCLMAHPDNQEDSEFEDRISDLIDIEHELQKRSYSEEDMIAIVEKSRKTGLSAEYLLLTEQFKKK